MLLIIDDNQSIAGKIKQVFQKHKHTEDTRILTANSLQHAEKVLEKNRITSILWNYDLKIDLCDGTIMEIATKWKRLYQTIETIFIYTDNPPSTLPQGRGIDAIFSKSRLVGMG